MCARGRGRAEETETETEMERPLAIGIVNGEMQTGCGGHGLYDNVFLSLSWASIRWPVTR